MESQKFAYMWFHSCLLLKNNNIVKTKNSLVAAEDWGRAEMMWLWKDSTTTFGTILCAGCDGGCKTQNSGLRSEGEKPRDPITQPSRCNTQEGLLSVVQTGDSDLLGGRAHRTANWASFLYAKNPYYQHITHGLQSDWLHVCKAILLVQTSRDFVQT